MQLDEARRAVAWELDSVRFDLSRSLVGRSLHPGIGLLLISAAAVGFWWAESRLAAGRQPAGALRSARRVPSSPAGA